ncbi:DUF479 domain-containing protein [Pseudolysobacter antarcticus]|uniref:DUF479 domain-containing protein n=1 Tax=Pseudolysobacter antarcticus TaxID=2511995 RepID=A0A411HPH4_9GAMM|nr:ACP phosphodiesterase [Pseudolysobacter antarcticus]QBB72320.1 DUF479 domain-containing protein [Pseudolysobacter antarcticus]
MNYLAHTLLAGSDPQLQLGGVLGDFWRGAPDPAWPPGLRAGVILHRHIDTFTDAHALLVEARALFVPPQRRYAGILLDVYFDHLLARDFSRYSDQPLAPFSTRMMSLLRESQQQMPLPMQRFIRYIGAHDGLAAYADPQVIVDVLCGIGHRLKHANPLAESAAPLFALAAPLSELFAAFFPILMQFAAGERVRLLQLEAAIPKS